MSTCLAATLMFLLGVPAIACSVASCVGHGPELNQTFTVVFRYEDKPLLGVHVQVNRFGGEQISLVSGADGKVKFSRLMPGDYSLSADLLGIGAGYQCFHVAKQGSLLAKRSLRFADWGRFALPVHSIHGHLQASELGKGGSPIWNITHRIKVPMLAAELKLLDPITGLELRTTSDQDGAFAFDTVPNGTYVLHIEAKDNKLSFDPTALLIRVDKKLADHSLTLLKVESGCGGSYLEPTSTE